ncbi:oxidoreductase, partial [Escherichia coli]
MYQTPFADRVRNEAGIPTIAVGAIFEADHANAIIASGRADAISFGRPFISNPDLVERIRVGAEWAPNVNVPNSWYFPGEAGYIDYPTLAEAEA